MNAIVSTRDFHWSFPPEHYVLAADEVHVWVADIEQESRLAQFAQTLSSDEQERMARFYFKRDRRRFVAARGVLRAILSLYTGVAAAALEFEYAANGKPRLANASEFQDLEFNLSHSGGLAAYAFSKNRRLGIDLEFVDFFSDVDDVASRCFSAEENSTLQFLDPQDKEKNFFRYWTRKESRLKCSGEGFSSGPDNESQFDGTLLELNPADGYVGSLAVQGKPFALQTWQWENR